MTVNARSRARSWALNLLYGWELSDGSLGPTGFAEEALERRRIAERYRPYALKLIGAVERDLAAVDRIISDYAANWRVERIGVIDRNILRLGIVELRFLEGVPPRVAIHEGVRLATRYGGADSPRFVNGVLDAVYREVAPTE